MSSLPSGWAISTISDASFVVRGITFPSSAKEQYQGANNVCCLRTSNIQREIMWNNIYYVDRSFVKRPEQFVQVGDVLMSMANSYELVGKVAVARVMPQRAAFGAFLAAIRPTAAINETYLFHLLRTSHVQSELRQGSSQTTNLANISVGTLSNIEIPLAPLAEQKRIANKLDAVLGRVDACRERLDRASLTLNSFRKAVLASATSGSLTEDWRSTATGESASQQIEKTKLTRREKFRIFDISPHAPFFEVPVSWAWAKLSFLFSPEESFCYGVVQPGENDPAGAFLIRAGDLNAGRVNMADLRRIPLGVHNDFSRSKVEGGEILVTVVGAGIGECAIVQQECRGFNIARAVAKLPIREFSASYVYFWLSTSFALQWMKGQAREVARPTLNLEQLKALPVPIPPTDEQIEIVRRVEILLAFADRLELRIAKTRTATDRLTPALLAKAFRGELVPQDPNDEPASELLKRLAASRVVDTGKPGRGVRQNYK